MKKRPTLNQLAYRLKVGELKPTDLPPGSRKKIERFASEMPLDELKAMAIPTPVRRYSTFQKA